MSCSTHRELRPGLGSRVPCPASYGGVATTAYSNILPITHRNRCEYTNGTPNIAGSIISANFHTAEGPYEHGSISVVNGQGRVQKSPIRTTGTVQSNRMCRKRLQKPRFRQSDRMDRGIADEATGVAINQGIRDRRATPICAKGVSSSTCILSSRQSGDVNFQLGASVANEIAARHRECYRRSNEVSWTRSGLLCVRLRCGNNHPLITKHNTKLPLV